MARLRDRTSLSVEQRCTRACLRALGRRIVHLNAEVDDHDRALTELLDQAAPQLIAERGIGYVTAAAFYVTWSHPGRCLELTRFDGQVGCVDYAACGAAVWWIV